jgi:hypothetical protein
MKKNVTPLMKMSQSIVKTICATVVVSASPSVNYIISNFLDSEDTTRKEKNKDSIKIQTSAEYDSGVGAFPNTPIVYLYSIPNRYGNGSFALQNMNLRIKFQTYDDNYLPIIEEGRVNFFQLLQMGFIYNIQVSFHFDFL